MIFVVDASGSMAARDRMAAVSGAALSLLRDAYQRRDKVAVITFRQDSAQVLLPPTTSAHIASRRLTRFDTGGTTPLAEGLLAARDVVVRERVRDRARRPLVVVLTDGRATGGPDPLGRSRSAAGTPGCRGCGRGGGGLRDVLHPAGTGRASWPPSSRPGAAARAAARRLSGAGRAPRRLSRAEGTPMPQGRPVAVPDDGLTTRARRNAPVLAVHTGAGKGKSTAAFGMALRAWNTGMSVAVFQFVKSAKWKVGEESAFAQLGRLHTEQGIGGAVEWHKMGTGWSWIRQPRKEGSEEDHAAAAADGWAEIARRLAEQRHDFYVLDEFTYPLKWGWIAVEEVVDVLVDTAGQPARRDHRARRTAAAARRRRPGDRDDQGQAPDGCRAQGSARHRVVTASRPSSSPRPPRAAERPPSQRV